MSNQLEEQSKIIESFHLKKEQTLECEIDMILNGEI